MEADDKFAQFPDATNKLVGDDGTRYFTDKDGIDYAMPKEWNRQNSYVYESPELHTYFEEILNNTQTDNVRLTDEMREYEPKEMFAVFDSAPPFRLMFMD
jgi:hypothetical protein